MSHQRARSENVTGTQGHTNMVFHKGSGPLQGKATVTMPGLYGLVNVGDGGRTQCGDAYCHFEGVGSSGNPGRNWKRWWRGMGPFVTNADESKSATLTVCGPGRTLQTKGGEMYGFFEYVYAVYDNVGTPKLHGDGDRTVYAGRIERAISAFHVEVEKKHRTRRGLAEMDDGMMTVSLLEQGTLPYLRNMLALSPSDFGQIDKIIEKLKEDWKQKAAASGFKDEAAAKEAARLEKIYLEKTLGLPPFISDTQKTGDAFNLMMNDVMGMYFMGASDIRDGVFRVGRVLDGGGEALLVLLSKPSYPVWLADEAMPAKPAVVAGHADDLGDS